MPRKPNTVTSYGLKYTTVNGERAVEWYTDMDQRRYAFAYWYYHERQHNCECMERTEET